MKLTCLPDTDTRPPLGIGCIAFLTHSNHFERTSCMLDLNLRWSSLAFRSLLGLTSFFLLHEKHSKSNKRTQQASEQKHQFKALYFWTSFVNVSLIRPKYSFENTSFFIYVSRIFTMLQSAVFQISYFQLSHTSWLPHADVILDERHCVVIVPSGELASCVDTVRHLTNRLSILSLQFVHCWMIVVRSQSEKHPGSTANEDQR